MKRARWLALVAVVVGGWQLQQGLQEQESVPVGPPAMPLPTSKAGSDWSPSAFQPAAPELAPVQAPSLQYGGSAWEERLSDARSKQLQLQADPGLSDAQQEAALQAHLEAYFSPDERPRVEALLRLMPN